MNKSEVCFKLTRNNCKKVFGILEMFGENTSTGLNKPTKEHPFISFNNGFWVKITRPVDRSVVKPRQLRNILAKEHLKAGDFGVFICAETNSEYVVKFDRLIYGSFYGEKWIKSDVGIPCEGIICFYNFLRYATDEEKALLEPNKEFGVDKFEEGVWYSSKYGALVNYRSGSRCYGWSIIGDWLEFETIARLSDYRKATEAEVIEALNKECVKRYGEYWETAKIEAHVTTDLGHVNTGIFDTIVLENVVWNTNGRLYSNGKWSEILKEPETYAHEVWVNHYSDREFYIHKTRAGADEFSQGPGKITVKATLTYDIPMTKV